MAMRAVEDLAEDQSYGGFLGGDPRDFDPDPECSTEEERATHKRDCEAMAAGGQALMPSSYSWEELPSGGIAHVARAGYGLGINTLRDPEMTKMRDEMRAAEIAATTEDK
jgi:hypothetical protein